MTQRNVYTSGTHLAPALVTPEGGGTAVRLDTVTYQSAGNHAHPNAVWVQETETETPGFMLGSEKYKLSTIAAGAEVNTWEISAAANNALVAPAYAWSGTYTQYALLTPSNDTIYYVSGGTVMVAESMRFIIPISGNGDYLLQDMNHAGTVYRMTDVRLIGGTSPTASVALKIGTTQITGMELSATSTASADSGASGANTYVSRNVLNVTIASVANSPTHLDITVHTAKQIA